MARLVVSHNGSTHTYGLDRQGLRIGRSPDNDLVLNHAFVSRRHATIEQRSPGFWMVDQESRNGVLLNQLPVRETQLHHGDVLQIGPYELRFEERAAPTIVLDDNRYFPLAAESRKVKSGELPDLPFDLREFFRVSKRLNSQVNLNELCEIVVEEAMLLAPAQRGVLMLYQGEDLVPMVVHPATSGELALSSTIVGKALDANEAVLTRDARLDFDGADSIINANIRSAICVPLIVDGHSIGLVYIDSPGSDRFTENQRDMLVAMALQAAINIERARMAEELRQQAELYQNLERFMSPNVARLMASYYSRHGQLWEPQELEVSVLFADIQGFTQLAETLSPREVQGLLNEYLHDMTEVIFDYNGTLDKYVGDGIMAVFGAPRLAEEGSTSQYAECAVDAALGMLEAHQRMLERHESRHHFALRIGINTGSVYAGFFGTRQRLEYTVLGDAVNTASRLESAAEPNSILIGEATCTALGDTFTLEPVGPLKLKGKTRIVHASKVVGRANKR